MGNVQGLRWPLRLIGAGLLIATAAIHLDLYLTGYRTIPTIGWLFLLQVIAAFALAVAVLAAPLVTPLAPRSSWLPAAAPAAGAGFAIATLGGYLLSLWAGLFGFREIRTTAGLVAGIIDIAAFAVLTLLAVISLPAPAPAAAATAAAALRRFGVPGIAGLTVVAAVVLAASVATANGGPGGPATAANAVLHTESINGVTVLTDSKGLTLYWFVPDTSTSSACYGTCAAYWPPVYGTPSVASGVTGVTGKFGTIHRTDGTIQATYNGHPLYTYIGDTAPGQASGNNVDLNGGFWYEVRAA
jgi:predicted lipoprotein with Yx(FWY)xxD motif